jgi:membrane-associated phospholipid phosphatase
MNADTREQPAAAPPGGGTAADQVLHVATVGAPPWTQVRLGAHVLAGLVALFATVAGWLTYRVFVTTTRGQRVDELAFEGAEHGQGSLWLVAEPVLDVVSVSFVVLGVGAAMAVALVRRRGVLAAQVAVLVGGANLTTQALKHQILTRPDLLDGWNGPNTLPSGHTTVAASVSVALLLATPRAWRPVVALLGGAYTAATGVSVLIGQWHRPSDVVAALLVVLAWGALVCALTPSSSLDLPARRFRTPSGGVEPKAFATPGSSVVAGLLLLGAAGAGGLSAMAVLRLAGPSSAGVPSDVAAYAAGSLAVLGTTAMVFALLLLLRQATARPRV